jgi:hypothetical protein
MILASTNIVRCPLCKELSDESTYEEDIKTWFLSCGCEFSGHDWMFRAQLLDTPPDSTELVGALFFVAQKDWNSLEVPDDAVRFRYKLR